MIVTLVNMEDPQTTQSDEPDESTPEVKATAEDVRGGSSSKGKGKKFRTDTPTMSEIKRIKKPNQRSCHILLDSSLSHRIDEKVREIELLERRQKGKIGGSLADTTVKELEQLIAELETLEEEAAEYTVEFTFQDIGRRAYDDLLKEHRPSEDEKKEYKEAGGEGVLGYSTATFPIALISRCSLTPKITIQEAEEIFNEWSEGDIELLFMTALTACKEPTSLPKSRAGTARTRALQQNSTTALSEESPTPDS